MQQLWRESCQQQITQPEAESESSLPLFFVPMPIYAVSPSDI